MVSPCHNFNRSRLVKTRAGTILWLISYDIDGIVDSFLIGDGQGLEIIMDKIEEELRYNYDKYVKIEPRPDEKESDYEGE